MAGPPFLLHFHFVQKINYTMGKKKKGNKPVVDVWGLDDVLFVAMNNGSEQVLIEDNFDSQSMLK